MSRRRKTSNAWDEARNAGFGLVDPGALDVLGDLGQAAQQYLDLLQQEEEIRAAREKQGQAYREQYDRSRRAGWSTKQLAQVPYVVQQPPPRRKSSPRSTDHDGDNSGQRLTRESPAPQHQDGFSSGADHDG